MSKSAVKIEQSAPKTQKAALPASLASPIQGLHREIDRLFDQFGETRPWFRHLWEPHEWHIAAPAIDVAEKDDCFEVTADLPGIDAENIEVKASDGMLTIRGEKREEKEEKKKTYHRSERHFGSFERSFSLPNNIDLSKITADYKAGVLTVTLPKTAEAQASERKISVTVKN